MGTTRTVHPHDQPVKPAIALLVLSGLLLVALVVGEVIPPLLTDGLRGEVPSEELMGSLEVIAVVILAVVALILGLGLATFILAIVVAVKGGGKLRRGAGLMIAAALFDLLVSFTISGDPSQFSDAAVAVSNAFSFLETIVQVVRALAMVAGLVFLVLGIREVRQQRAELARESH